MKARAVIAIAVALASCSSTGIKQSTATTPKVKPASTTPASTPATDAPAPTEPPTTKPKVAVPPTTARPKAGTRTNPFSSNLDFNDFKPMVLLGIEPVDAALIHKGNQFNDAPQAGQTYVRVSVSATYTGSGSGSSTDITFSLKIAGDKSKIYEAASISDAHNVLGLLRNQPDVIQGGSLTGFIYYLVDTDDSNFLAVVDGPDGPQFARIGAP